MTRFFARVSARVGQAYTKLFPNTLKKRTWWPVFGVGVLLIAAMGVGIAHGQAVVIESLLNGLVDMIATILIELSKLCIFLTIFFLRAFITLASYNNFIDVSVVKLGWVMVRDVANMFFIVGLLVIAFATILGFESYEWKHGLVKIVLMAILINFSNLIAQLVIDVAHIFTITFLNAVSATAGGNLITMFQMDKILELAQSSPSELGATRDVASLTLFAGSVLAFIFALLAALTIGAYLVVMIFRIVVLWALIVLSPLAFMLYAVPKGEDYAHEWWSEFSKHVIVAPIMVFFLWLAFATLGTGQIISEIQSDPNVIQLNSSGEKQSVTVLEISTWENFASFLLGIGFLWVGIKKTEETGATGAGLVGGAIDFTKNVATIATGYAAGRWLVGAAIEKGKEVGGAYGKLGLARLGETKFGKVAKTISGYDRMKKSSINLEEALSALERKKKAYKAQLHAEASKDTKGLAGWLSPTHEKIAEQEAKTKLAERELHSVEAGAKADASKALFEKEKDRFQHLTEHELHEHGVEHELQQQELNMKIDVGAKLFVREQGEFEKKNNDLLSTYLGPADKAEYDRIMAISDEDQRNKEMSKFEGKMAAAGKDAGVNKRRELENQAAEGLPHIRARLLETKNKQLEEKQKGIENKFFGEIDLSHVMGEQSALIDAINGALEKRIKDDAAEIAAIKELEKTLGTSFDRTAHVDDIKKQKEVYLAYDNKKFRDEILDKDGTREEAIAHISEQERALIMESVLIQNPSWLKVQAFYATRAAEQKTKKAAGESDAISLRVSDVLRGVQGKVMDEIRNFERTKIAEEMKGMREWSFPEFMNEFTKNQKILKQLNEKIDLLGGEDSLSVSDKDLLKNTRQNQARAVASGEDRGFHVAMVNQLKDLDSSYEDISDDKDTSSMLLLGMLSGRSFRNSKDPTKDLKNPEYFAQIQEEYRKGLKEKAGILFRTLQKGIDESAQTHGQVHLTGNVREGIDGNGTKILGIAGGMRAGAGSGKIIGTGDVTKNGLEVIEQDMSWYTLPDHSIFSSKDGRSYTTTHVEIDPKTKAKKTVVGLKAHAKGMIAAYTRIRGAEAVKKEGTPKLRALLGAAGFNESLWNGADKFERVPSVFQEEWQPVFNEWKKILENPEIQSSVKTSVLNGWQELYTQWGVDPKKTATMDASKLVTIASDSGLLPFGSVFATTKSRR